jgi:hypothetical protein
VTVVDCRAALAVTVMDCHALLAVTDTCHCEERSDEAIHDGAPKARSPRFARDDKQRHCERSEAIHGAN